MTGAWRDGNGGSDYMPQACILVNLKTGLAGRSNHGRIYLPQASESEQTKGIVASATVGTMQISWQDTRDAWSAAALTLGVASYKGSGAFHPVSTHLVENHLATQRRRMGR